MKASLYPEEAFCVWAAFHHRRSTRWQATRSEEFLSASQGRGITSRGRLALTACGRFLALEAEIDAPLGHWLPSSALIPAWNAGRILPGGYDIRAIDVTTRAVQRGGTATGIYRGAGRPEAACLMERLADKAARAAGIDPLALRQENLLPATVLPHETPTGNLLDSGDYAAALRHLAERADYAGALADRDASRAAGGLSGVGIAFYLEPSGSGWESARVTFRPDGTVLVASGGSAQGQPRSAFARIAATALGIDAARVSVHWGDSATCPEGIGALASRSTAIGGSAVLRACEEVRARRDAGEALPLTAEICYETEGQAWGYGAYLAALTIDRETGRIRLGQLTCVDDTGRMIDPEGVKGQIRGGAAQGLGEALMERLVHDGEGQLLTGSLTDYALPRAADMPPVDIHTTETPSPMNALGAKGVGEAGTIGAPAAILNAAADALAPLGIDDLDMPLTSHRIWHAIREAERTGDR